MPKIIQEKLLTVKTRLLETQDQKLKEVKTPTICGSHFGYLNDEENVYRLELDKGNNTRVN